jgi:hypothetical protein
MTYARGSTGHREQGNFMFVFSDIAGREGVEGLDKGLAEFERMHHEDTKKGEGEVGLVGVRGLLTVWRRQQS